MPWFISPNSFLLLLTVILQMASTVTVLVNVHRSFYRKQWQSRTSDRFERKSATLVGLKLVTLERLVA